MEVFLYCTEEQLLTWNWSVIYAKCIQMYTHAHTHARTHTHTAYFLFLQQIQSLHQTTKDPENDGKRKDERVAVWLVFGAEGHLEGFKGGGWDRKTTHQTIHRVRCWSGLCKNRWMFSEYKTKMDSVVCVCVFACM